MASFKEIKSMWAELGMDLEKHDEFLNSFPSVMKEIIATQENRPQAMEYFTNVVRTVHGQRPYELFEHKKQGGKVFGTYCVYVPDEVLFALGAVTTGLCGGDQFWVPGGEKVLPRATCALIKSSVGSRLDRTSPFCQLADLYIGEATCDGKKKAWEILARDVPMHIMDMPQKKREKDIQRFAEEIWELVEVAENLTGKKLTSDALADSIRLINEKRRALIRLHNTRKSAPAPISGKDALMVTQVAFYDGPARFARMVNELCEELEERLAQKEGPFPAGTPRIMISGSPMALPNWKLHHLVETSGAVVVCEEQCTGTRYYENLVDESAGDLEGQIMALARRYMETNCACFHQNEGRMQDIARLADDYRVDAVIDYSLQFCGLYSTESYLVKELLQNKGLPYLHIESDYSQQDSEALRTRIEALIEMLA